MQQIRDWKNIVLYVLSPEDTSGAADRGARTGCDPLAGPAPGLSLIKGFFWAAIAVIAPLALPVLVRIVATLFN